MSRPFPARALQAESIAPVYPDDLTPAIQETLAILADLAFAHEAARERLAAWDGPESVKSEIAGDLEARHQAAVEPYARRLQALHQRARDVCTMMPYG